ncbi:MAG: sugar ABC transporter ATP-binding protein, partial [Eubacteriales bacterium]|nr:sugar ABC transporter ATP-binding protein [Eubacteriales bacterium]
MADPILVAQGVDKSFGVTHAVNHVSLEVGQGEIRGLIGENGSGKSTLCSMLCGIHTIDSGHFLLNGKELKIHNQVEANHAGVSIIVQEMGTLSGLTVAENIFLGSEDPFVHFGIKNTAAMNRKAQVLLDSYGFQRINASLMIDNFHFEDRKLIEIVKATYFKPQVVVIDETTTALSQYGREELYKLMDATKADGRTVIFISHDLFEVIQHTDTITILRDGELIDTVPSTDATEDELKRLMVGRELDKRYYRADYGEPVLSETVLSAKNVTVPGQIHDVSFALHRGEILGFGGLSECGMHEVGKAVFGASFDRTGSVTLADGTPINSIPAAIRHSIAYASKDRDNESLILNDTICDNIILPSVDDLTENHLLKRKKLRSFADEHAEKMSVKMTSIEQFVSALSGGNRQKVVLARWLGKASDILVLDSPTRGIDVKVKADIYALMADLR